MTLGVIFAEQALLPEGWARDVRIEIGPEGDIARVETDAAPGDAWRAAGSVIPGMPNLHSHAFQRAMAGLTEQTGAAEGAGEDSFWTWRKLMYGFVGKLTPAEVEAIAAQLYVEMLKSGYTAVAEFHYLHHDPEGRPYGDLAEMSERVIAAARSTGIGMTLLPVLYGAGGFGGKPAAAGQRRFLNDPERFLSLIGLLCQRHGASPQLRIGIAPHSLRAVTPEMLSAAVAGLRGMDATAPIHIHIAEQTKEVEDCLAWSEERPVEWLLAHQPVDAHWCMVHATHMTGAETKALAASGAVAGLCPTTEANLGDGFFPAEVFLGAEGRFGIGSDSHISVSPVEELRWLEYGQRLVTRRRNVLRPGKGSEGHIGASLWRAALAGGALAAGRPLGAIAPGLRADLVVLDGEAPGLFGRERDSLLDAMVFAGNQNPVRDVFVGGRHVVEEGHHIAEHAVLARFRGAMSSLLA
jgi:formimidoylglutamate deiminase